MSTRPTIWTPENGALLQQLRINAKMDIGTLAQRNMLSRNQVIQLEEGGDSSFYSPEIKYQVGKKLLGFYGHRLVVAEKEPPQSSVDVASAPNTFAQNVDANQAAQLEATDAAPLNSPSATTPIQQQRSGLKISMGLVAFVFVCSLAWFFSQTRESNRTSPTEAQSSLPQTLATAPPSNTPASEPIEPKSQEPISIASPAAPASEPMPTSAKASDVNLSESTKNCVWTDTEITLKAPAPKKAAEYVYIIASKDAFVCVMDGNDRVAKLTFKGGEDRSVYGAPPFKIQSAQLQTLKIFFQGQNLNLPNTNTQQIQLVASDLK